MIRRIVITVAAVLGACAALLAAYETSRVLEARSKAPGLIASALAHADPEIFKVSSERINMLLRVEDPTFWTNDGIDFATPGAGKTTLTQSLGKDIYFPEGFQPGFPKIELMLTAKFATTALIAKQDILHAAMARYYFSHADGRPVIGLADAARTYFGKLLSQLNDDQYLALVAMLPAPGALNPARHPEANAERVRRIKRYLANQCAPAGTSDNMLEGCA